ncbi:MAG: 2-dehydropantoate 2-reductase [Deltaproteobacteria bacterium]|nr:2-dehydropantoate 2-reductase [Deltaproteobacteria bacterium]
MNIAILGAGAMGSVYGAFLASQPENEVVLINVWAEHIEAVRQKGLLVVSDGHPDMLIRNAAAAASADGLPPQDLVIVLVKAMATERAMRSGLSLVGPETMVLTLQNGLGNLEKLGRAVNPAQVVGGVSSFGAYVRGPGEIFLAARGETVLGETNGRITDRILKLRDVFDRAGLAPVVSDNIQGRIWTKLVCNVGINALCALLNFKNGQLLENPESEALMTDAVNEAVRVAKGEGIVFESEDVAANAKKICLLTKDNVCSMLQDVRTGRPTEICEINGAVVELGRKLGLPTPVNMVLTSLVKVMQTGYLSK